MDFWSKIKSKEPPEAQTACFSPKTSVQIGRKTAPRLSGTHTFNSCLPYVTNLLPLQGGHKVITTNQELLGLELYG